MPRTVRRSLESKTSPRRIKALQRAKDALTLRLAGYTYQQIGDKLGMTKKGAEKAIKRHMGDIRNENAAMQEELRGMQSARLDALLQAIYARAVKGDDLQAIDRVLSIEERRAKLFGLDTPAKQAPITGKIDVEVKGGLPGGH